MLTAAEHGLLDLIDIGEAGELVRELVRRPSPNPPGSEEEVARFLADTCADLGLRTTVHEVSPGRPNVHAGVGPEHGRGLLLLGHTDTVPAGDGWSQSPFDGDVVNGRVVGRGAADMKGGIAAAVLALATLQRSGRELAEPVGLAAVVDEEEGGQGIRAFLAGPPVEARAAIVAEPTELQTIIACRGNCYVDVDIAGRSAHAGSPEKGRNAIYGAARVVEGVRELHRSLAGDRHPTLGPAGWSVGVIQGGTATAMVPDRCRVALDRRLLPGESGERARAQIEALVSELDLEADGLTSTVELLMEIPSFELDAGHELVTGVMAASIDAGAPARPVGGWSAACDGGYVMRHAGIPTVVLGPGSVVDQAHRPDESVALAEVVIAARAYVLCAARLCHLSP